MSAAWNGPIVAALVALVMAKYFADSIVGVGPFGDLGVLAASASASASAAAAVLALAVAVAAVQAAAATVHAAATVSVPDVAAFVAVVVVVVVAAAVCTAAVVVNDDVVLAVDVVHAAVGFGFVAVLLILSRFKYIRCYYSIISIFLTHKFNF